MDKIRLFTRLLSDKWHVAKQGESMSWGNVGYRNVTPEEFKDMKRQGLIEE